MTKKNLRSEGQKKMFDLRAIRSGWGRTLSGVADVVDTEELFFSVDADEATINSLEMNTIFTFARQNVFEKNFTWIPL